MYSLYKDKRTDDLYFISDEEVIVIDTDRSVLHITDPKELHFARFFILDEAYPTEDLGKSFGPVTYFAGVRFRESVRSFLKLINPVRIARQIYYYIRRKRELSAIDKIRLVLSHYGIDDEAYSDEEIRELGISVREIVDNTEVNLEVLAEALQTVNREIRKL